LQLSPSPDTSLTQSGARYVLPVQAKAHIAPAFQASFDYHCKMDMPLNPIPAAVRADCLF